MSFRRHRTFVVAWLTALLVAVAALALPATGLAAETGAIEGTVTGEGAGGLAGVEVCAEEEAEEAFVPCVKTVAGGAYEIPNVPEGEYTVEFWPEGQNFVRQFYDEASTRAASTAVPVTEGTTTTGIDAVLEKGAKINGVVTAAATGLPVSGVEVCAFGTTLFSFGCGTTNVSGAYTIVGLAGDRYEVWFEPPSGQNLVPAEYALGLVTVAAKGEANGVNQALVSGGQISGTVRLAATGAPLAGVRVCLVEAEVPETLGCLTSPASGAYRFLGLWNAGYKVVFSAEPKEIFDQHPVVDAYPTQWWQGAGVFATATPIAITPPAIVTGIDASLGPPPAAIVTPSPTTTAPLPVKKVVKKPLKCRKGFAKRKVCGKARCVRVHKAPKHKHRHKKKS
ncbi:MAG: hypothetical protein BGO11_17370 [Solirubrobacterales bacterium 70-9]|nr:MAG: hypothetical protein BGO11_17370 [Solirubrobacterales bacterium 70-9]